MTRFLSAILLFILIISCADDTPRLTIPYAPVNFIFEPEGQDFSLREGLSFKVFTEPRRETDRIGYAGLLIVSDATGTVFYAYDLCCPYEDDRNIRVIPGTDGKAECPVCNSVYVTMFGDSGLGFGTPEKGPSKEPLQSYMVSFYQQNVYRISN